MTNSGTLAFDRGDVLAIPGVIAGTGGLSQLGTGTTTLSAAANYSGATYIAAGVLVFDGNVTDSIAGVTGSGTLKVETGTTLTSDGVNMPTGCWVVDGVQTIRANGSQGTPIGTSMIGGLSIDSGNGGTLDLGDNYLIIQSNSSNKASVIAAIKTLTLSGYNGGNWEGSGLTSSALAADVAAGTNMQFKTAMAIADNGRYATPLSSFGGLTVDANCILITRACGVIATWTRRSAYSIIIFCSRITRRLAKTGQRAM